MSNELISIIVPIYNCEQYLKVCVDSIINQTYKNLEIILVDDGSTDSSGDICDEYARKDSRIKVIHKQNGGLQDARNTGIAIAKGTFIGFVDSDDWIDDVMYENLYKNIGSADLVTSGLWLYDKNGIKNKVVDPLAPGKYDGQSEHFCNNLIITTENTRSGMFGGILNNIWCKLFKASIVKKCYAAVNINITNGEDLLFVIAYALMCREIVVTHECYYHYRYNAASMSHTRNKNYLTEMNRFYHALDYAIMGHAMENNLRDQLNRLFMYFIHAYAGSKMQLGAKYCYPIYVFPQNYLLNGKNVILFGAGNVGKSYYHDWQCGHNVHVAQWIDNLPSTNEISGQRIYKVEEIVPGNYDYVVCAVLDCEQAEAMRKQMIDCGIRKDKILWEPPINIFHEYFIKSKD